MKVIRFILLVLFLFYGAVSTAYGQGPAQGFEKTAMSATLALYGHFLDTDTHKTYEPFLCSAFVIGKDATGYTLLTAGHCATSVPNQSATYLVSETIGGPLVSVEVIAARYNKTVGADDFMLLHLTTDKKYPVLRLGDESTEHVGSVTFNPNFALGLGSQFARGVIASQRLTNPYDYTNVKDDFIVHEFAGEGASGSPVISATTHQVVGILVGMIDGLGFLVEPISIVKADFAQPNQYNTIHVPPSPVDLMQQMLEKGDDEQ
jgi:S1-C subfamily serine protease